MHRICSVFPKYLRQSLRSTVTGCRQTQVFGVLSDLSPIILPCESKNQHCDEKGVSSRKDFGWYDAFLPARGRENQERSASLDAADYTLTGEIAPQGPCGRGIPQGCGHSVSFCTLSWFPVMTSSRTPIRVAVTSSNVGHRRRR